MGAFVDKWLSPVGSFATGAMSAITSAVEGKKNRDFQREMYDKQVADARADYAQQLRDQWSFEEYRSYPNQAKLMREAGINPNGSGQISTGGASSSPAMRGGDVPSASNRPVDFSGIQDSMHVLQQGLISSSQLDIQREQNKIAAQNAATNLFRARTEDLESKSRIRGLDLSSEYQEIKNDYARQLFEGEIKEVNSRAEMNLAHSFQSTVDTVLKLDMHEYNKQNLIANTQTLKAEYTKLIQEANYFEQLSLTSASQAYYYDSMARLNGLKADWQDFENSLKDIYKEIQNSNATKAEREAAWAGFRQFASGVGDLLSGVAQGVFAFLSFKGGKSGKNIHQGYNVPPASDKPISYSFEPDFENMIIN